ncbi:MAG TPA: heavy metal-associated domain-containing protein [Burkholderiales bacterium]|nr:heavy metal-associated domain-containing protein [Burkholderiales bacterium]
MSLFGTRKKTDAPPVPPKGTIVALKVEGMTCANCVRHVGDALREVPGVFRADVDLKKGEATVDLDPAIAKVESLRRAVADVGYEATLA